MTGFIGEHFDVVVTVAFLLFGAVLGVVSLWDALPRKQ
jgi:hypothetical protein